MADKYVDLVQYLKSWYCRSPHLCLEVIQTCENSIMKKKKQGSSMTMDKLKFKSVLAMEKMQACELYDALTDTFFGKASITRTRYSTLLKIHGYPSDVLRVMHDQNKKEYEDDKKNQISLNNLDHTRFDNEVKLGIYALHLDKLRTRRVSEILHHLLKLFPGDVKTAVHYIEKVKVSYWNSMEYESTQREFDCNDDSDSDHTHNSKKRVDKKKLVSGIDKGLARECIKTARGTQEGTTNNDNTDGYNDDSNCAPPYNNSHEYIDSGANNNEGDSDNSINSSNYSSNDEVDKDDEIVSSVDGESDGDNDSPGSSNSDSASSNGDSSIQDTLGKRERVQEGNTSNKKLKRPEKVATRRSSDSWKISTKNEKNDKIW